MGQEMRRHAGWCRRTRSSIKGRDCLSTKRWASPVVSMSASGTFRTSHLRPAMSIRWVKAEVIQDRAEVRKMTRNRPLGGAALFGRLSHEPRLRGNGPLSAHLDRVRQLSAKVTEPGHRS
jgi:hypothetical protein